MGVGVWVLGFGICDAVACKKYATKRTILFPLPNVVAVRVGVRVDVAVVVAVLVNVALEVAVLVNVAVEVRVGVDVFVTLAVSVAVGVAVGRIVVERVNSTCSPITTQRAMNDPVASVFSRSHSVPFGT